MKPNELKIYYGGGVNTELDDALRECAKPFGYEQWASGFAMRGPRIRDLAFEKEWLGVPPCTEAPEPPPGREYPEPTSQASDTFWMQKAYEVAEKESTCLSHKCGAVLVLGGFLLGKAANGVPPGEQCCRELGCPRWATESGDNLHWCRGVHAESAVIAVAAATQAGVKGSMMYTTRWPCVHCWRLIALAGIVWLVYAEEYAGPVGGPVFEPPASVGVMKWSLPR